METNGGPERNKNCCIVGWNSGSWPRIFGSWHHQWSLKFRSTIPRHQSYSQMMIRASPPKRMLLRFHYHSQVEPLLLGNMVDNQTRWRVFPTMGHSKRPLEFSSFDDLGEFWGGPIFLGLNPHVQWCTSPIHPTRVSLLQSDSKYASSAHLFFWDQKHLVLKDIFSPQKTTSWWFQPTWKIWVKMGSSSPSFGIKKNIYLSCHQPNATSMDTLSPHISPLRPNLTTAEQQVSLAANTLAV